MRVCAELMITTNRHNCFFYDYHMFDCECTCLLDYKINIREFNFEYENILTAKISQMPVIGSGCIYNGSILIYIVVLSL